MPTIVEALKKVQAVYDDPDMVDRYTVIMKNGNVFGISKNVKSPFGMNEYLGDVTELPYVRSGKRVNKQTLPYEVKCGIAIKT